MRFTIASSETPISKSFQYTDGKFIKGDGGNLIKAEFVTKEVLNVLDLMELMSCLNPAHLIISGTTKFEKGRITTKANLKKHENEMDVATHNYVTRTKKDFEFRGGEGFLLIDYDPCDSHNDGIPFNRQELLDALCSAIPELKTAPMLWKTSSSSNIYNSDNDEEYSKITGQHLFVHVRNTLDIERIAKIFYKRLWLDSQGYIFITKTGRQHDRTIMDKVVNSPEREIFTSANCISPVKQNVEYEVFNEDGEPLDTEQIHDISIHEEDKFEKLLIKAKDSSLKLSDAIKADFIKRNHEKLGVSDVKLRDSIENNIIYSDTLITLGNGVSITVKDLFNKPEEYDGEYCHDPLEPGYGGISSGNKAWIDIDARRIYSHAHGGIEYTIENSERVLPRELALNLCKEKDHNLMFKRAAETAVNGRYIDTEIDVFISSLCALVEGGLKISSARRDFNHHYKKLSGSDSINSTNKVNYESDSHVYDADGKFNEIYLQNISLPISHQFPHTGTRGEFSFNLDTIENFRFLCDNYGIKFSYDVIRKIPDISFPKGVMPEGSNKMSASMSRLKSLCVLNGIGKDLTSGSVTEMFNANEVNPVLEWIQSVEWDGIDRITPVIDGIGSNFYGDNEDENANTEFSDGYKDELIKLWLTQCVAALDKGENSPLKHKYGIAIPKYEYILVFVGNQGVQKTKFIKSLLPTDMGGYILSGHELDTKDKDSIKIAISHWITELGELDSTFRRSDISALKAFMSKEYDQIRMPYAPVESNFVRQTSFCASVNDVGFLVDKSGNRRYLPLHVNKLTPLNLIRNEEDVAMNSEKECQQLWSQVYKMYIDGKEWWPSEDFERKLDFARKSHDRFDSATAHVDDVFDLVKNDEWRKNNKTTDIYKKARYVVMNGTEVAKEMDADYTKNNIVSSICEHLRSKGIHMKVHREGGNRKKGFRLCVREGVSLKRDFSVPRQSKG